MIENITLAMSIFNEGDTVIDYSGNQYLIKNVRCNWGIVQYFYDEVHCLDNSKINFNITLGKMGFSGIMRNNKTGGMAKISILGISIEGWEVIYFIK